MGSRSLSTPDPVTDPPAVYRETKALSVYTRTMAPAFKRDEITLDEERIHLPPLQASTSPSVSHHGDRRRGRDNAYDAELTRKGRN